MVQKIVIINGNPESGENKLNQYLLDFSKKLQDKEFEIRTFLLHEKEIKHCVGCWDCWWKTPGVCRFKDDVVSILRETISSDLVIFASPLIMGMYSALLKRLHDRMIPIVHPYLEIVNDECHHRKRYPSYPKMGVIYEACDALKEEIENVDFIFRRIAINMHSEVKFFYSVNQKNPMELSHEMRMMN